MSELNVNTGNEGTIKQDTPVDVNVVVENKKGDYKPLAGTAGAESKTFTQDEVNTINAETRRKAQDKLALELGLSNAEELKAMFAQKEAEKEAEMSEIEKIMKDQEELKSKLSQIEDEKTQLEFEKNVDSIVKSFPEPTKIAKILTTEGIDKTSTNDDINIAIEKIKVEWPELFEGKKAPDLGSPAQESQKHQIKTSKNGVVFGNSK